MLPLTIIVVVAVAIALVAHQIVSVTLNVVFVATVVKTLILHVRFHPLLVVLPAILLVALVSLVLVCLGEVLATVTKAVGTSMIVVMILT